RVVDTTRRGRPRLAGGRRRTAAVVAAPGRGRRLARRPLVPGDPDLPLGVRRTAYAAFEVCRPHPSRGPARRPLVAPSTAGHLPPGDRGLTGVDAGARTRLAGRSVVFRTTCPQ